jgi:hypothetical protein
VSTGGKVLAVAVFFVSSVFHRRVRREFVKQALLLIVLLMYELQQDVPIESGSIQEGQNPNLNGA